MPRPEANAPGSNVFRSLSAFGTALSQEQRPFAGTFFSVMPRYFFHLKGSGTAKDTAGVRLQNDAAARQEAILRSLSGQSFRLQKYRNYEFIEVLDEGGRVVCEVAIEH
jgi:hypothetical protein